MYLVESKIRLNDTRVTYKYLLMYDPSRKLWASVDFGANNCWEITKELIEENREAAKEFFLNRYKEYNIESINEFAPVWEGKSAANKRLII